MKTTLSKLMNKGQWLTTMLAVVFGCGCHVELVKEPTINWKLYTNIWGGEMPRGICWFGYKKYESLVGETVTFQDSCHLYNVGDKLNMLKSDE
jgi:hypothetical protein